MVRLFRIYPRDNVAVTFSPLEKGDTVYLENEPPFPVVGPVESGHKVALHAINKGEAVIKYGVPIGSATCDIRKGEHVHAHNLKTALSGRVEYSYQPVAPQTESASRTLSLPLQLYFRKNKKAGIRNELWVLPTVGCVNSVARTIADTFQDRDLPGIDGVYSFAHPYGCSQLGDDHERTRKILQNIALHPNAGGVLVLGLGCENNQVRTFIETLPEDADPERVVFLEAQREKDEVAAGAKLLEQLYEKARLDMRSPGAWSDLAIGLECGGSDAFSGITANPLIGKVSDYIVSQGGTTALTEVPEMFGAEHILMQQCVDREIFGKTVDMINAFKDYYEAHNQPIYENPSPGNKKGGITTLEEKSLGCTRKAGSSPVMDVVPMEKRIVKRGLNLLYSPGNDIVATTALGAAGCQLVLFSTGRGTPLGGFIPTLKIASNSALAEHKAHWIDFNAGALADQKMDIDRMASDLLHEIKDVINGKQTSAERRNNREFAIFKTGVTL